MGEDEMKLQITQAYNKIMEDSRMVRLPGHVPAPTDVGLWKLKSPNIQLMAVGPVSNGADALWIIDSVAKSK